MYETALHAASMKQTQSMKVLGGAGEVNAGARHISLIYNNSESYFLKSACIAAAIRSFMAWIS